MGVNNVNHSVPSSNYPSTPSSSSQSKEKTFANTQGKNVAVGIEEKLAFAKKVLSVPPIQLPSNMNPKLQTISNKVHELFVEAHLEPKAYKTFKEQVISSLRKSFDHLETRLSTIGKKTSDVPVAAAVLSNHDKELQSNLNKCQKKIGD